MMDESEYETIDVPEGYNINSQQAIELNIHVEGQYNVNETTTTKPQYQYIPPVPTTIPEDDDYLPEQYNPFLNFNHIKKFLLTNILKIFK